jgi:hypothetical protein
MRTGPRKLVLYGLWLPLALVLIPAEAAMKKGARRLAAVLILLSVLLACSGAKSTNSNRPPPTPAAPLAATTTPAGAYTIVIHAHAGAMESSTAVQLTVQ